MAPLSDLPHRLHPINASEDVGALRRAAANLAAEQVGVRTGEAELVATEMGTNLLKHASPGGYVLYRRINDGIEFLSVDNGPRKTTDRPAESGLSAGLAGIRRMATEYDYYSSSAGTVVLARLGGGRRQQGPWGFAGVNVPLGGTGPSGDGWAFSTAGRHAAALLVDGLGHGEEAAVAAQTAVELFKRQPVTDPADFLFKANAALHGTRGGVAGVCVIDTDAGRLTFAGIGNIACQVVHGDSRQHLVSRPGTIGTQLSTPKVHVQHRRWLPGTTLVMNSDGIRDGWNLAAYPGLLGHNAAVIAAAMHRDFTLSTDDAAVLVVRDLS